MNNESKPDNPNSESANKSQPNTESHSDNSVIDDALQEQGAGAQTQQEKNHIADRLEELEQEIEKIEDFKQDINESMTIDEESIDAHVNEQLELEQQRIIASRKKVQQDEQQFSNLELESQNADDNKPDKDCLNCNAILKGSYCHECGQPERHFIRFFPKVFWEMINEAFDLDSKIFRTIIPLILSPGRLTMEYIAGRRARYVNPLRLYIITSILFFITISIFTDVGENPDGLGEDNNGIISRVETEEVVDDLEKAKAMGANISEQQIDQVQKIIDDVKQGDSGAEAVNKNKEFRVSLDDGTEWHPKTNPIQFNNFFGPDTTQELNDYLWELKLKAQKVDDDPKDFVEEIYNIFPQLMFILLPLFALLLKIVYIFKKRYYMEHLVVALHSHSFIFLSLMSILLITELAEQSGIPDWLVDTLNMIGIVWMVWVPINLFLQQKRIYAQGKFMTFIKFIFIGVTYANLLSLTAIAAVIVGLVNL